MSDEPNYSPEGHVSLDALAEGASDEPTADYSAVEELARLRNAPRRGARRPSEYEQVTPLNHEGLSLEQVEKQLRMRRVLDSMEYQDVSLLVKRYVTRMTLQEIADETGVTPQAVAKRLDTANKNFKVAFARTWDLPLDVDYLFRQGKGLDVEFDPLPGEEQ